MKAGLFTLIALAAPLVAIPKTIPKTPESIRLLSCVVNRAGLLEAEVENTSDAALLCNLRCDYALHETSSSHWFEVSIPARFKGIVGPVRHFSRPARKLSRPPRKLSAENSRQSAFSYAAKRSRCLTPARSNYP